MNIRKKNDNKFDLAFHLGYSTMYTLVVKIIAVSKVKSKYKISLARIFYSAQVRMS